MSPALRKQVPSSEASSCGADDVQLVRALAAGSRTALETVYRTHRHELVALARTVLGSTAEAEDVVQDVFVGLTRSIHTFERRASLGSWLRRITVLRARMHLRALERRREVRMITEPATRRATDSRIVEQIATERAMAALPESYRSTVLLRAVKGLTHGEIAEREGISVSTSHVRLFRARRMLRDSM